MPEDTAVTLSPRLAHSGAELMISTLAGLANGTVHPQPQDNSKATLAPILKKEDGLIDFSRTATETWNRLRGFQPWPGAFTTFRGKTLATARGHACSRSCSRQGRLTSQSRTAVFCWASPTASALDVLELQVEGKKRMNARDFVNGYRPRSDEPLGATA